MSAAAAPKGHSDALGIKMGIEDRDWYRSERARKARPEDDYFLKSKPVRLHRFAGGMALVVLLVLVAFGLRGGWFDGEPRADPAKVSTELEALRQFDEQSYPGSPRPVEHARTPYKPQPVTERPSEFRQRAESVTQIALAILAVASPVLFIALLVSLFFRRARGPAGAGLLLGSVGVVASVWEAELKTGVWRWIAPSGGWGDLLLFVAGSFSLSAIVGVLIMVTHRAWQNGGARAEIESPSVEPRSVANARAEIAIPPVEARPNATAVFDPVVAAPPPTTSPPGLLFRMNWPVVGIAAIVVVAAIVMLAVARLFIAPSSDTAVRMEPIPAMEPQPQRARALTVTPVSPGISGSDAPHITGAIIDAPYAPDWQAVSGAPAGFYVDHKSIQHEVSWNSDDTSLVYLDANAPASKENGVRVASVKGRLYLNCKRRESRLSQTWSFDSQDKLVAQDVGRVPWTPVPRGTPEEAVLRLVCGNTLP